MTAVHGRLAALNLTDFVAAQESVVGRASLASRLASMVPKEHPDGREPSHLGNVG
jgi:hypothetical protein